MILMLVIRTPVHTLEVTLEESKNLPLFRGRNVVFAMELLPGLEPGTSSLPNKRGIYCPLYFFIGQYALMLQLLAL
jgi:hypothetical protein